jgi:hypothetical protein
VDHSAGHGGGWLWMVGSSRSGFCQHFPFQVTISVTSLGAA